MEIVCDQLFHTLEYERILKDLSISGREHLEYFLDNPDKRHQRIQKLNGIRNDIAEANLRNRSRENLLGETKKQLKILDSGIYRNQEYGTDEEHREHSKGMSELLNYLKPQVKDAIYGLLGAVTTYMALKANEKMNKANEEAMRQQYAQMIQSMNQESYIVAGLKDEMNQIREGSKSLVKLLEKINEKIDEKEEGDKDGS